MEADLEFFQSIEWCSTLLADPDFKILPTVSRIKKDNTLDELFASTLKTQHTIAACLTLFRTPTCNIAQIDESRTLLHLGYQLNGYPNVCHGGIVATILDEVMAILMRANRDLEGSMIAANSVTVHLNTSFIKPVKTPQTVLVVARICKVQGRKYYLEATIQDAERTVLANGEAFWLGARGKL